MRVIERSTDDWMNSFLYAPATLGANAKLYIVIRAYLRQVNPSGATGTYTRSSTTATIIPWDDASWRTFRADLETTVESGWNNNFWLEPDRGWAMDRLAGGILYRPNVKCSFTIWLTSSPRDAHVTIACRRLAAGSGMSTSNMLIPRDDMRHYKNSCSNDSCVGANLDDRDMTPKPGGQIPVLHEFGHYIGLDHVNRSGWLASAGDPVREDQYGVGAHQRGDLMGAGSRIEAWHSHPWCRRLRLHLTGPHPGEITWTRAVGSNTLKWKTGVLLDQVVWTVHTSEVAPRRIVIDGGIRGGWPDSQGDTQSVDRMA